LLLEILFVGGHSKRYNNYNNNNPRNIHVMHAEMGEGYNRSVDLDEMTEDKSTE